ncbi:M23 family metallopeptidase [Paraburkholderia humisilvae]|nr:M23 family metallopeptidase [Paraburkholderia humisilvae]
MMTLPLGVAMGVYWANGAKPTMDAAPPAMDTARRVKQDYVTAELGHLNAAIDQIDPRLARVAHDVAQLRDFQARLSRAVPTQPTESGRRSDAPMDGEGGPLLPPKLCIRPPLSRPGLAALDRQTACLTETLSALEAQTAEAIAAWDAYPGRMPVAQARFGSPFGNRVDPFTHHLAFHAGLDLVAPLGTWILATASGRVVFAGGKSGYGNVVEIDHGHGFMTRYAHASRLVVHAGDIVLPGDHIADVGSTGRSTGPHLHFEVLFKDAPTNPADYLVLFNAPDHG